MAIRLACHAITWGGDTLGAIKDISDVGFRGIECFTHVADQYADAPERFRAVLDLHDLELVCLYGGGRMLRETREHDVAFNRRIATFVARVGGKLLNLGGGDRRRGADGRDQFTDADVHELCETLNRIGEACRDVGVRACYHPHIDTIGEEKHHIDQIFAQTDPELVYAGPDPAHLVLGSYDPGEFAERYAARIAYWHFKNVPAGYNAQNWRARRAALERGAADGAVAPLFSELDEGQIDLSRLAERVQRQGYDGWITTEIDTTRLATPRASAERSRAFWEAHGFGFD